MNNTKEFMMYKKTNNEKGSALLVTIMILGMLGIVASMAVNRSTTDVEMSFNQLHSEQSFYVAEAGFKKAFYELNQDNDWRVGFDKERFGVGYFGVEVFDSSSDSALIESLYVTSIGSVDLSESTIEAWLVPEKAYPFRQAMFAKSSITMAKNTCTDSYNSDSGSYADTRLDSLGTVGSNGTVLTGKDSYIGGDIQTATDDGITLGPFTTVNGDTTSSADSINLNIIPESSYDFARINSGAPASMTGDFTYNAADSSLVTGADGTVELGDGVYYFSSINLGQNSQVTIAPGANVKIYVTGNILFSQQSTLNDGGNPWDMQIYSQGSALQFDQDNIFYGTFYGPDTDIQYDQTTSIYGSIVGNTVSVDQGACFHYDRNLAQYQVGVTGKMLLTAWKEQ